MSKPREALKSSPEVAVVSADVERPPGAHSGSRPSVYHARYDRRASALARSRIDSHRFGGAVNSLSLANGRPPEPAAEFTLLVDKYSRTSVSGGRASLDQHVANYLQQTIGTRR